MILFFFTPWAQLLGVSVSGYDLQKLGSYGNFAWLIPVSSGITIVAGLYGKSQTELAQLTGALPILGLVYGLVKVGSDLFHILAIGAYLTLLTGLALLFVTPRISGLGEELLGGNGRRTKTKTSDVVQCVNCGVEIPAGDSRCPKCGWSWIS